MRNLKKALSLALASVMVMGMTVVGSNAAFADVDTYDHKEAIDVMQLIDVMVGDQNGNFNPDQKVTRNEMAVIIAKMMNLPLGGNHPFKDVPAWADKYVAALYSHGITGGTSATTYGGDRNITAKEAGLMMMKTLGYFAFEGEYGDDWALAAVRQANQINLFKDMGVYVDQQLTRNDVALLALNAMQSNVVVTEELGGLDVSGNGINVNQKPFYQHNEVKENTYDYRVGVVDSKLQLVEKLYGRNLVSNGNQTDAFGRPAVKWTYKSVDSVVSPKAPSKVYTAPVKAKDVAADLGVAADASKFVAADASKYYENGALSSNFVDVSANPANKVGNNGDVIEAYLNDNGTITMVVTSTYFGEIKKIENDGKVNRAVVIDNDKFETQAFAKGDKVLYTKTADGIQSVALVGAMQTGTVTKKVGDDLYIDDVKTDVNAACKDSVVSVKAGDKVEYYVDGNGYIVKMDIAESIVTLDKVGYLKEVAKNAGVGAKYQVLLVMSDGTEKVLNVENAIVDGTDADPILKDKDGKKLNNKLVSISEKDDKFTLKLAGDKTYTGEWKNNNPEMSSEIKLDSTTVFVYAITDSKDKTTYEVYTGYRNALSTAKDKTAGFTAKVNDKGTAELVYVVAKADELDRANAVENWVFVLGNDKVGETVLADGTKYYEYNAVVDGKVTTVKTESKKTSYEFANAYTIDKDGMISYETTLDGYTADGISESTNQPIQIEYKNGVIVVSEDQKADNTEEMKETNRLNPSKDIVVVEVSQDHTAVVTTLDNLSKGTEMYSDFGWVMKDSNKEVQVLVAIVK